MTAPKTASPAPCPSCGRALPADAPSGLCPACLLHAGLPTPGGAAPAPDLDAVRAALPQFEVLELLGQGGMGVVWRARQRALDRVVALKVLPRGAGAELGFAERFAREARALARLQHEGIVQVYEFGETPEFFWLAMEFVDGVTLRAAMREKRLSPREALAIVPQICDALQYAHDQGVVHRDVKPENVLLDRRGRVKIADFGLAKLLGRPGDDAAFTRTGLVMGTPHYMAPEQFERPTEVDHRADIYSLGVVFYEMLTGELPLGRFAAPSRKVEVDVRLDEIVLRALEKEPERRWQHAADVRTHVTEVADAPARPRPFRPATQPPPAPGETPQLERLAVAGLAVVVFAGCAYFPAADVQSSAGMVASGLGVAAGWFACLFGAIRIHHARGRLRGMGFAAVGLLLPLVAAVVLPIVLMAWAKSEALRHRADMSERLAATGRALVEEREREAGSAERPVGTEHVPVPALRSDGDLTDAARRSFEEIRSLWEELRANHAALDAQSATRLYVPEIADWLRTQIEAKRDVRDGSCGIPLASEETLRGRLSTLLLRGVHLDDAGSFANCEASDGVRCVTFQVARWRHRPDRAGRYGNDPDAFRWSFTADPIEVR